MYIKAAGLLISPYIACGLSSVTFVHLA